MDFFAYRLKEYDDKNYLCHLVIINKCDLTCVELKIDDNDDIIVRCVRDDDISVVLNYISKIN